MTSKRLGRKVYFFSQGEKPQFGQGREVKKISEWRGSGVRALIEVPQQLSDELVTVQLSVVGSFVALQRYP